ncbi:hypothetical protein [Ruminococcus sp.]|uniref:hypothetical protein n=1 Tax=Ruminococcus sp. TaxID=41978 RepID=UPI0025E3AF6C|nr:hypothetical protein [Ruminococcus sp.]MBQ8967815.1 hypothetical protein [Ruminococcus sp.]
MACFLIPTAEAIVTTAVKLIVKKKENNRVSENDGKIKFSEKLGWLNGMLWGGSGLLAFEHLWHGEISPFFPFLTAANDPADTAEMLHEMATSGSAMALLVTLVWAGLVLVTGKISSADTAKAGDAA